MQSTLPLSLQNLFPRDMVLAINFEGRLRRAYESGELNDDTIQLLYKEALAKQTDRRPYPEQVESLFFILENIAYQNNDPQLIRFLLHIDASSERRIFDRYFRHLVEWNNNDYLKIFVESLKEERNLSDKRIHRSLIAQGIIHDRQSLNFARSQEEIADLRENGSLVTERILEWVAKQENRTFDDTAYRYAKMEMRDEKRRAVLQQAGVYISEDKLRREGPYGFYL